MDSNDHDGAAQASPRPSPPSPQQQQQQPPPGPAQQSPQSALGSQSNNFLPQPQLPPTKIKRQYKCTGCDHTTINPRQHLRHRIDVHGHKLRIVECPLCVYACQYRQKLNRHLKLVHHCLPNQVQARINLDYQQDFDYNFNSSATSAGDDGNDNNNSMTDKHYHQSSSGVHPLAGIGLSYIHAYASQLVGADDQVPDDEPIDLSFPLGIKLMLRSLGSEL